MIDVRDIGPTEQLFTHQDEDGTLTTYAASRLAAFCEMHVPRSRVAIEPEAAALFNAVRGVEPHRLQRLGTRELLTPLVFVHLPDGTHLLVDGTHRYVRLAQLGVPDAPAYLVSWEAAQPFLVRLTIANPDALLKGWSGIA
jgi:hypothetical protein